MSTKKIRLKPAKKELNEWMWGWAFIFPTFLGLLILNIIPAFQTLILSFRKSGSFGKTTWVGLDNYSKLIKDKDVWQAVFNTFGYAILVVPCTIILSLIVAVLLNKKVKGKSLYRTIYFMPMVAAPAAIAMVWRWLYNSKFGIINYILSIFGVEGPKWISDPKVALISIALVGIWSNIGYNMVLLLAGLQEIPSDYYEASNIDGASPIRQFFNITLPLVSPTMFFVLVTSIISSLQVFDLIFMMIDQTNAALVKTQSLVYLFYKYSFIIKDKGYGSAIVMLLLLLIMIITVIQTKLQNKWVNYN